MYWLTSSDLSDSFHELFRCCPICENISTQKYTILPIRENMSCKCYNWNILNIRFSAYLFELSVFQSILFYLFVDAVHLSIDGTEEPPASKPLPAHFKSSLQALEIFRKIEPVMEEAQLMAKDSVTIQRYSYQSSFPKQVENIYFLSEFSLV